MLELDSASGLLFDVGGMLIKCGPVGVDTMLVGYKFVDFGVR
jgi:hypothetical protein